MKKIYNVGKQILKGCLRAKSLSLILFFAISLIFFITMLMGSDSANRSNLIIDSGLSLIKVFALLLVAFIVLPVIKGEKERHTLAATLSFTVSRTKYLWGVFTGTSAALFLNYALMSLIFVISLMILKIPFGILIFRQLFLTLLELHVINSLALLFSVSLSYVVATMVTGVIFVIGNMTFSMQQAIVSWEGSFVQTLLKGFTQLIPNLSLFNLKDLVIRNATIPYSYDLTTLIYSIAIIAIAMELATWKMERETIL
jgi:ABC-type transport system involved in multi-copper enzyme maturation permease subunit